MSVENENQKMNDIRIIQEGESPVNPDLIKGKMSEEFQTSIKPFGGRVVVAHLNQKELDNVLIQRTSGLLIDVRMGDIQLNSKLNIGKILALPRWYNPYNDKWVDYSEAFEVGEIILFEMVRYTPVIPNKIALVPLESIHCSISDFNEMARIISSVRQ